jgi:hypothetical protein
MAKRKDAGRKGVHRPDQAGHAPQSKMAKKAKKAKQPKQAQQLKMPAHANKVTKPAARAHASKSVQVVQPVTDRSAEARFYAGIARLQESILSGRNPNFKFTHVLQASTAPAVLASAAQQVEKKTAAPTQPGAFVLPEAAPSLAKTNEHSIPAVEQNRIAPPLVNILEDPRTSELKRKRTEIERGLQQNRENKHRKIHADYVNWEKLIPSYEQFESWAGPMEVDKLLLTETPEAVVTTASRAAGDQAQSASSQDNSYYSSRADSWTPEAARRALADHLAMPQHTGQADAVPVTSSRPKMSGLGPKQDIARNVDVPVPLNSGQYRMVVEAAASGADAADFGAAHSEVSDDDMREISYSPPAASAFDTFPSQANAAPINTMYGGFRIQSESPALDADVEDESEQEYSPPPVNQSLLVIGTSRSGSLQMLPRAAKSSSGKVKKPSRQQRQADLRTAKAERKAAKAAKRAEKRASSRAGPATGQMIPQSSAYVPSTGQFNSAMAHDDRRIQGDNPRVESASDESELCIKQESITPPHLNSAAGDTASRRLVLRPDGGADIEIVPAGAVIPQYNLDAPMIPQPSKKDRNKQSRLRAAQHVESADSDLSPPRRKAGRDSGNLRRIASLQHATRPHSPEGRQHNEQAREPLKQRIIVDEFGNEYIAIPARSAKRPFTIAAPDSNDSQVNNARSSVRAPSRAAQRPQQTLPENVIDLEDEEDDERTMMPPPPVVLKKQRKGQAKKEAKQMPVPLRQAQSQAQPQAQPAYRSMSVAQSPASNTAFLQHVPAQQQQVQRSASVQGMPFPLPSLGFPQMMQPPPPPPPPPQSALGMLGASYAPPMNFLGALPLNNMQPPAFASFPPPPRPFSTQPQPFPQYAQQPYVQPPPPFPPQTPGFMPQTPHFAQPLPFSTPFLQPQALQQPQFPYNGVPGQFPLPQGTPMLPHGGSMPPLWPHQR